jgi:hypothetical protein
MEYDPRQGIAIFSFVEYRKLFKTFMSTDCLDIIEEYFLSFVRQEPIIEIQLLYKNYSSRNGEFYMDPLRYCRDVRRSRIGKDM